jgi:hypothetical protein
VCSRLLRIVGVVREWDGVVWVLEAVMVALALLEKLLEFR